jgi:hypothetical protein
VGFNTYYYSTSNKQPRTSAAARQKRNTFNWKPWRLKAQRYSFFAVRELLNKQSTCRQEKFLENGFPLVASAQTWIKFVSLKVGAFPGRSPSAMLG